MTVNVPTELKPFIVSVKTDSSEKNCPAGHRLSIVGWRLTKAQEAKGMKQRASVCVPIPTATVTVTPDYLSAAMNDCIADFQDRIVSEAVNNAIGEDTAIAWDKVAITAEMVSLQGIADWCALQAEKGRLSKDSIGNWFDTALREPLERALAAVIPEGPTSDDLLTKALESHRSNLQLLANPRAGMPEKLVKQLLRAVGLAVADDKVKSGLTARLASLIKPVATEMDFAIPD